MFAKLFFIAAVAIACVSAKPGIVGAPLAYSAPLVAAPALAPALAYTAGYANVGDSAVVTSHNSQVINPAFAAYTAAAYTAAAPLAYTAAAPFGAPLAYSAPLAYASPLAAKYVL
ncbi:cuticle protein 38-like [Uranotaenia lowii]|uniref:cuticle protein 38-like n=1 Tax=Uranotaenia lowii TaxID=190385 RepID=UPI0024791AF5|nr:cuticle protein 38-like [Uranotaenia lowii]